LPRELDHPLTRTLVRAYRPFVHFALRRPVFTLATAIVALASCVPIAGRLGGEFLPRLDEGDLLLMPTTLPGVKPERAAAQMRRQDAAIAAFPEVDTVFGKVGRADTATDPAPFSMAETTVRLRPQAQWPLRSMTRWYSGWAPESVRRVLGWLWPDRVRETPAELLVALDRATRTPGWTSAWTAPARARRDMMSTGFRTTVGIRIMSSERDRLAAVGRAAVAVAARVPGARSAVLESSDGEPRMAFDADADALRIHGADPSLVQATADLVIAGGHVGNVERGGRRVRVMVVPGSAGLRGQEDRLRDTTVRTGAAPGQPIALALLGRPRFEDAPSVLRTENGERVAYVYVDLDDGVDPASYVDRARREMAHARDAGELQLRPGERIEWAGQYALYAAGARRFRWIVGLAGVSMVGLLAWQLGSFAEALIVSLSVPFALVGSVWTLFLLGYPLSAPVWVGLLSAAGLAMQTGVVTVVYIDESFRAAVHAGKMRNREDIVRAHGEGTIQRLRPKVMTVATMGAALVPLLWASGAGAEIVKRVAAPMIGGLATSTLLTLEVLPVLYTIWRGSQLRRATPSGRFSL
ncbi:MAG TPA: efflux RND transporter permease subunit, partial [Solirubrobacteraceae bacterium]